MKMPAKKGSPPVAATPARTPDWQTWSARPSATLTQLCLLTLNVSTARGAIAALRRKRDPRVAKYQTHLNTLKKLALVGHALPDHPAKRRLALVSVVAGEPVTSKTEFRLDLYIDSLRSGAELPGVTPPSELLELAPPRLSSPDYPQASFEQTVRHPGATVVEGVASIVQGIAGAAQAPKDPTANGVGAHDEKLKTKGRRTSTDSLVIGLLVAFIRELAQTQRPLPTALLKGPQSDINLSQLAKKLHPYLRERVDQSPNASAQSGGTERTIRHALGEGYAVLGGVPPKDDESPT